MRDMRLELFEKVCEGRFGVPNRVRCSDPPASSYCVFDSNAGIFAIDLRIS